MARDIYYQSIGNPLQSARLPKRRPHLQLPFHPYSAREDGRYAVKLLVTFTAVALVSMIAQGMQVSAAFSGEQSSLLWTSLPFLLAVLAVVLHAAAGRDPRWLRLGGGAVALALLYTKLPLAFAARLLVVGLALGTLALLLGMHWAGHCTAAPMDRRSAARLTRAWHGYLSVLLPVPAGLLLVAHFLSVILALAMLVAMCLYQIATVLLAHRRLRSLDALWQAVVSWLTYNRHDTDRPGILHSSAGDWVTRMVGTALCVFLVASLLVQWPAELLHALRASESAGAPVAVSMTMPTMMNLSAGGLIGLALSGIFPVVVCFLTPLLLAMPVLLEASVHQSTGITAQNWPRLTAQLRDSVDPIERKSLFMGVNADDGTPVLVPRGIFHEHAHYLGDSGSGKTSRGLAPVTEQLGATGDCSFVVIDLKGDSMELYATLQATAEAAFRRTGRRIPLKHFSNQIGHSTFAFNPLLQPYWHNLELYMRTDILCGALGLTYGADYGEGYYSSANAAVLYHALKTFPNVTTYRELAERVHSVVAHGNKSELNPEIRKAGVHVGTVLQRLGAFEALNVAPGGAYADEVIDGRIDLSQVFVEPQIHYFQLSSTLGPGSSPEIARLVTYSLLAAATQIQRRNQVFLVIDEFQRMVARNCEYMLQLARSMGVGVILANQSMQDLRTSKTDLITPVESNCRYRQWYSVSSEEDRQRLVAAGGETIDTMVTRSYGTGTNNQNDSVSYQEQIVPRLSPNDIILASDHPKQSIVRIARGAGYAQFGGFPLIVESDYHISETEYRARKSMPWPSGMPGTFTPTCHGPAAPPPTPGPNKPSPHQPGPSKPGPVVTTEVIGDPQAPLDSTEELFASFLRAQTNPDAKPSQQRTRKDPS